MKRSKLFIPIILIVMVVMWFGSGYAIYYSLGSWGDRGTFGDMFGAVNALFSGFALVGVVYAIILQQAELTEHRVELGRAAEAQEISAKLVALSSVLSHLDNEANRTGGLERKNAIEQTKKYLIDIEALLK